MKTSKKTYQWPKTHCLSYLGPFFALPGSSIAALCDMVEWWVVGAGLLLLSVMSSVLSSIVMWAWLGVVASLSIIVNHIVPKYLVSNV
jgi:hypothetical protein